MSAPLFTYSNLTKVSYSPADSSLNLLSHMTQGVCLAIMNYCSLPLFHSPPPRNVFVSLNEGENKGTTLLPALIIPKNQGGMSCFCIMERKLCVQTLEHPLVICLVYSYLCKC